MTPKSVRTLGGSGISVTSVGLGSWQFSGKVIGSAYWKQLNSVDINDIVAAALEGGINWFDTAELYGFGRSEKALARALAAAGKTPDQVMIATKWFPAFRPAVSIKRTIDRRLANVAPFEVGLHQVHFANSLSSVEKQMDVMADLVEQGKIKAVGISNYSATLIRRAHRRLRQRGVPLAAVQTRYNLLDRTIDQNGVLDTAKELGITVIAYSPLQLGLLSGKYHRRPETVAALPYMRRRVIRPLVERSRRLLHELEEIAAGHNVTPAQAALNWLINAHGETVVAIPGATSADQATRNAEAMKFQLSAAEMAHLDRVSRAAAVIAE
ncbi:MAG: aldo/keto reductase [Dehalogenimonas sp.]|uniref:Aldo/keto reductase n=1 Tax=Candidatus Dehalogenimonas loeffleri TaxID=3127115 RepID=A0ABZ2J5N3_9CHLR|nr:aldo/keto reductase [Dehalogenimonas sp.]